MNASLEARVPFLDRDLVEVAMAIPHSVKTDGDYKPVLRKTVEDFVPSVVLKRDKMGFSVPVSEWIEDRRDPIERWISEEKLDATPYVDTEQVRTAYAEHYRGTKSHSRMLFRVLVYVAWHHTVVKPTEASIIKLSP
jgi:asparagine synthase (glutamine-hydrolysing)